MVWKPCLLLDVSLVMFKLLQSPLGTRGVQTTFAGQPLTA